MDGFDTDKKYEPFKIQGRQQVQGDRTANEMTQAKTSQPVALDQGSFYEIEYDSCPIPGVGKFVLKPQKIVEPEKDEKRDLFGQMRDIARAHRSTLDNSRFFDRRVQQDHATIFYKQGMFMKDFSDDYSESVQFSQYFPYYQQMGFEQLRTYFTWRTQVRKGNVADTDLSYVFLYIYELLGNIGVSDPQDGLNQLMYFWKAFGNFNKTIDRYVLRWLKDYHIYYELPHSFKEFIDRNNLTGYYPKMTNTEDKFNLYCNLSKYDIRKSTFFTEDNVKLITDCFYDLISKLKEIFEVSGINFDESIFQDTKKMSEWKPFKDALFYPWLKQANRRIVLSDNEIFICNNNKWSFSTVLTSEHGRQLIGYIMKQMEVALRKVTKYKFKLSANIDTVSHEAVGKLKKANLSLETIINNTVVEFYKEATKTVVIVDHAALSRIRQEALATQEKLIVPENERLNVPVQGKMILPRQETLNVPVQSKVNVSVQESYKVPVKEKLIDTEQEKWNVPIQETLNVPVQEKLIMPIQDNQFATDILVPQQLTLSFEAMQDTPTKPLPKINPMPVPDPTPVTDPTPVSNPWKSLKNSLTDIELNALSVVLHGETELKKYADECKIMLEVLVDGINEKAMDFIGDNLLDEEFALYDDYKEQVKELIG